MADLPDWTTSVVEEAMQAGSFVGGADAAKSAAPVAKDIYLATDTKILYVCIADGAWAGFDYAMLIQGTITLYANQNANSKKITDLAAPAAANDAARKTDVDAVIALLDDISQAQPVRALATVYQNTSGKIRLVTVGVYNGNSATSDWAGKCTVGATSSPATDVAWCKLTATLGGSGYWESSMTFIVMPNYYYKVTDIGTGTLVIDTWTEWDLL